MDDPLRGKPAPIKGALARIAVAVASTALAVLLAELGSRIVLDPVDYLAPTLVRDDILGVSLSAGSGGHDRWGFRNHLVPESADLVALGDSHTYGHGARLDEAWPQVVGRLTGASVYSLSLGGYGPNQYYFLLGKALSLKPKTVVCGLYMGDDFDNAFRVTYGLEHWSFLRRAGFQATNPYIWATVDSPTVAWHQKIRNWLSGHSILYRLVFHGLLQDWKGHYQVANASRWYPSATSLIVPEESIEEAFIPGAVLRGLDQQSPSVREGMRITFELLSEMSTTCERAGVHFVVALIPTKETVYARHLEHKPDMSLHDVADAVIANERVARSALLAELEGARISYVDTLPALERAAERERIYSHSAVDMHPNRNGYRVIATAIAERLRRWRSGDG